MKNCGVKKRTIRSIDSDQLSQTGDKLTSLIFRKILGLTYTTLRANQNVLVLSSKGAWLIAEKKETTLDSNPYLSDLLEAKTKSKVARLKQWVLENDTH